MSQIQQTRHPPWPFQWSTAHAGRQGTLEV